MSLPVPKLYKKIISFNKTTFTYSDLNCLSLALCYNRHVLIFYYVCAGFTFSFPSDQKSLKNSILVTWTKSFKCPDGVGQDACVMLEEAIARRKVRD